MSTRISQGSSFQPATLKGTGGPVGVTAAKVELPPPPKPPEPRPPVDEFVRDPARDFQKLLGTVQAVVATAAAVVNAVNSANSANATNAGNAANSANAGNAANNGVEVIIGNQAGSDSDDGHVNNGDGMMAV